MNNTMEERFKQVIKNNKLFIIFYMVWFLINLTILTSNSSDGILRNATIGGRPALKSSIYFWPFQGRGWGIKAYDSTEFFYYLIVPLVLFGIWKLIEEDVKKYIKSQQSERKSMKSASLVYKKNKELRISMKKHKKSGIIVLLIIILLLLLLFYSIITLMNTQGESTLNMVKTGNFFLFILRIITVITIIKKSKEINENKWAWGIFSFLLPTISLILMLVKLNKANRIYKKHSSIGETNKNL